MRPVSHLFSAAFPILIGVNAIHAQVQRCSNAGVATYERIEGFEQGLDGSFFVAGWPWTGDLSFVDMEVLKLDADGNLQWGRVLQGGLVEYAKAVAPTSDGGAVLAGYTASFGQGLYDLAAVKLSSSGSIDWTATIGTADHEAALDAVETSDGGLAFAGSAWNSVGLQDGLVVKLQPDGQLSWAKRVHGSNFHGIELHEVVNAPDNGLLVTGYKTDAVNGGVAIRFDAAGTVLWAKELPYGLFYGAAPVGTSGFVLTGFHYVDETTSQDICIVRVDADGDFIWGKKIPYAGPQQGIAVAVRPDDGFVVAGDHMVGSNDLRMLVVAFGQDGDLEWNRLIGTSASNALGIVAKPDNGFVLGGGNGTDALIAFLDANGMTCPACGVENLVLNPVDVVLSPYAVTTLPGGAAGSGSWTVVANTQTTSSTVCLAVGVDERPGQLMPRIRPNPAADWLDLEWPGSAIGIECEILDAAGRIVVEQLLRDGANRIDIRRLPVGAYRIVTRSSFGEPWSATFIVSR